MVHPVKPGGDASSADGRGWRRGGGAGFFRRRSAGPASGVGAEGAAAEECPKSLVTPASIELVERFFAWKTVGLTELTAREAEAFVVLEREWRMEQTNGQQ